MDVSGEVISLAAEATPYISAAVGAYGTAVLMKVRDDAADTTVGLGRRILKRVFGEYNNPEELPSPLAELAANPQDNDVLAAVRLEIRKALEADPGVLKDVSAMLHNAQVSITAQGPRSIASQMISGTAITGDNAMVTLNKFTKQRDHR